MAFEVQLTLPEFNVAVQSAMARILISAGQDLNHASTYKRTLLERLQEETVGCCAELAIGKLLARYSIPAVGTFHSVPDYLQDLELRATARLDGRLIVRDNDHNDRRYVFATVTGQVVTFVGWMYGYESKKERWLTNPKGYRTSWFVPQRDLRPIETLAILDPAPVAPLTASA